MDSKHPRHAELTEAHRAREAGDYRKALQGFEDLLEDTELEVPAYRGIARTRADQALWTLCADAWAEVLNRHPNDFEALKARGHALMQARCPMKALECWNQVSGNAPLDIDAVCGRAEALISVGRPDEALRLFDSLGTDADLAHIQARRAFCLTAVGRYEEAVSLWEKVPSETHGRSEPGGVALAEWLCNAERSESGGALPLPHPPIHPRERWPDEAVSQFEWGLALLRENRHEDGVAALEDATRQAPDWTRAARRLAVVQEIAGNWAAAAQAWDRVSRLAPNDVDAAFGLAEAQRLDGSLESAVTGFDRLLNNHPEHHQALASRAAIAFRQDALDKAESLWSQALEAQPDDTRSALGMEAIAALEAGQEPEEAHWERPAQDAVRDRASGWMDEARDAAVVLDLETCASLLQRVTTTRPGRSEAWLLLGHVRLFQRRVTEAHDAYAAVDTESPLRDDAEAWLAHTLRLLEQKETALNVARAVLARRAHHAVASAVTALIAYDEEQWTEAVAAFESARRLNDRDVLLTIGHARALEKLGRAADARGLWTTVDARIPHHPAVRSRRGQTSKSRKAAAGSSERARAVTELERGRAFYKERRFDAAARCFQRALGLDPNFAEAALRLGMAWEDSRQYLRAIEAYQRCLSIDPNHYQAATNVGEALRKGERYSEALRAYDRALALKPDYLYGLAGRAECMRMLGDCEASLEWFDKALSVGPRHAFAVQGKAAALNALYRYEEALPLWVRALEIEPTSVFAREGKLVCEGNVQSGEVDVEPLESATPTLDEQGRDLTALAQRGKLSPVIGRDVEIRSVMKALVRRLKGNPLLLGDPGVGKTAVVEGLAQRLTQSDAPARLKDLRIIELSMGSMVAGTKYRGTFEERLKEIIKEASTTPGLVLFIDEIHTLVGAGRTEGGSLDAANILKPALARGEITVIGATTMTEYRKHFESDSALDRRFQPISIEEPSEEEAIELLRQLKTHYAEHHGVQVEDEALNACVRLAVRYLPERRLPDKALDLLDDACADASLNSIECVTERLVARVVSDRTGVPVEDLTAEDRLRLAGVQAALSARVIGQQDAVRTVASAVQLSRSGLRSSTRPRGVYLFVGRSGVGKTELALTLADFMFPEGKALLRLDMSEFGERHTASRLLGAPPGYAGQGQEGQLTGVLRRRPYAVVLLDEFEKAHPDVQAMFLALFDEGRVTDSYGREINAREAFFVLTTNAGAEAASRSKMGFGDAQSSNVRAAVMEGVKRTFRPELLNRLDDVVVFEPLHREQLEEIVKLHLRRLTERASLQGLSFTWDAGVAALCASHDANEQYGARPAIRAVDELVATPMGKQLLDAGGARKRLHASVKDGKVVFEELSVDPVPQGDQPEDLSDVGS